MNAVARAIVSEKGQVTVPKLVRDRLGIRSGQVLEFRFVEGGVLVSKAPIEDSLERAYGSLKLGATTAQVMRELRGDYDPL